MYGMVLLQQRVDHKQHNHAHTPTARGETKKRGGTRRIKITEIPRREVCSHTPITLATMSEEASARSTAASQVSGGVDVGRPVWMCGHCLPFSMKTMKETSKNLTPSYQLYIGQLLTSTDRRGAEVQQWSPCCKPLQYRMFDGAKCWTYRPSLPQGSGSPHSVRRLRPLCGIGIKSY